MVIHSINMKGLMNNVNKIYVKKVLILKNLQNITKNSLLDMEKKVCF